MTRFYETPGTRIRTAADVLSRSVDDDIVLYNPATDAVTHLDAVAAHIWTRLVTEPTLDELVATLAAEFAADPDVVRADAIPMLETLRDARLLEID